MSRRILEASRWLLVTDCDGGGSMEADDLLASSDADSLEAEVDG